VAAAEGAEAEVVSERASHVGDAPDPLPILRSLRRLRSDVALLSRTTPRPVPQPLARQLAPALATLSAALGRTLGDLAVSLERGTMPPELAPTDAAIAAFEDAWAVAESAIDSSLRAEPEARAALALPFAIETLRRDLGDFAGIVATLAKPGRS
jgi:hypothetical protein